MAQLRWTVAAASDLEAITEFIAADSPQYAKLFANHVFRSVAPLTNFPRLGRVVPESGNPAIREIIFGNYRLIYRVREDCVEIISIYHASRLLGSDVIR